MPRRRRSNVDVVTLPRDVWTVVVGIVRERLDDNLLACQSEQRATASATARVCVSWSVQMRHAWEKEVRVDGYPSLPLPLIVSRF